MFGWVFFKQSRVEIWKLIRVGNWKNKQVKKNKKHGKFYTLNFLTIPILSLIRLD